MSRTRFCTLPLLALVMMTTMMMIVPFVKATPDFLECNGLESRIRGGENIMGAPIREANRSVPPPFQISRLSSNNTDPAAWINFAIKTTDSDGATFNSYQIYQICGNNAGGSMDNKLCQKCATQLYTESNDCGSGIGCIFGVKAAGAPIKSGYCGRRAAAPFYCGNCSATGCQDEANCPNICAGSDCCVWHPPSRLTSVVPPRATVPTIHVLVGWSKGEGDYTTGTVTYLNMTLDAAPVVPPPPPPPLPACTGSIKDFCDHDYPATWCCNLKAHNCVCTDFGTYGYIANYCNTSKNDGIHCPKCKKHGKKKCKCKYNGADIHDCCPEAQQCQGKALFEV